MKDKNVGYLLWGGLMALCFVVWSVVGLLTLHYFT